MKAKPPKVLYGWAVFNVGTIDARLERIDEEEIFPSDEAAIRHVINHAHAGSPACQRALRQTINTDPLVRILLVSGPTGPMPTKYQELFCGQASPRTTSIPKP